MSFLQDVFCSPFVSNSKNSKCFNLKKPLFELVLLISILTVNKVEGQPFLTQLNEQKRKSSNFQQKGLSNQKSLQHLVNKKQEKLKTQKYIKTFSEFVQISQIQKQCINNTLSISNFFDIKTKKIIPLEKQKLLVGKTKMQILNLNENLKLEGQAYTLDEINQIIAQQKLYFEQKYEISRLQKEQRHFCIVMIRLDSTKTVLNNFQLQRAIKSIFQQNYQHSKIIYFAQSDQELQFLIDFRLNYQVSQQKLLIFKKDPEAEPSLNILKSGYDCLEEGSITMIIPTDSKRQLIGTHTLSLINSRYTTSSNQYVGKKHEQPVMLLVADVMQVQKKQGFPQIWNNKITSINQSLLKKYQAQIRKQAQIDVQKPSDAATQQFGYFANNLLYTFETNILRLLKEKDLIDLRGTKNSTLFKMHSLIQPIFQLVGLYRFQHLKQTLAIQQTKNLFYLQAQPQPLKDQFIERKPLNPLPNMAQPQQENFQNSIDAAEDPVLKDLANRKAFKQFETSIYIKKNSGSNVSSFQYQLATRELKMLNKCQLRPLQNDLFQFQVGNNKKEGLLVSVPSSDQFTRQEITSIIDAQKLYYQKKFPQMKNVQQQLGICVIVPSFNNNMKPEKEKIRSNLNSIFQQEYSNYHVIFIDDNSRDGTTNIVKQYVRQLVEIYGNDFARQSKFRLVENQANQYAISNIVKGSKYCNSGEIMVVVDGDDYLIGKQVFRFINSQYQTKNILTLYTNHLRKHDPFYLKVGTSSEYPQNVINLKAFRQQLKFSATHLRTFYVDLFRNIQQKDLKDNTGAYYKTCADKAIMIPILEMAAPFIAYSSELMYVCDAGTGLNTYQTKKTDLIINQKAIKQSAKYQPLLIQELDFLTESNLKRISTQIKKQK